MPVFRHITLLITLRSEIDKKKKQIQAISVFAGVPWVVILSQDCFYKEYNEKEKELIAKNEFNFDHPGEYFSHSYPAPALIEIELLTGDNLFRINYFSVRNELCNMFGTED